MRRTITAVADMLILGTLLLSAALSIYTSVTIYPLSPYWIELLSDYSGGFVRRFLLGEIIGRIPGVSPEAAGLVLLTACYVFVMFSLYAGCSSQACLTSRRVTIHSLPVGTPDQARRKPASRQGLARTCVSDGFHKGTFHSYSRHTYPGGPSGPLPDRC